MISSAQLYSPRPDGIPQDALRGQFNTREAEALAQLDPRYQIKKNNLDRPGFSRSAATMSSAGRGAAQDYANAIAEAYGQQLQNEQYNANADLRGAQSQEQYAQSLGGLNQQNAYARQMAALQRQQTGMGIMGDLLGGLLS